MGRSLPAGKLAVGKLAAGTRAEWAVQATDKPAADRPVAADKLAASRPVAADRQAERAGQAAAAERAQVLAFCCLKYKNS